MPLSKAASTPRGSRLTAVWRPNSKVSSTTRSALAKAASDVAGVDDLAEGEVVAELGVDHRRAGIERRLLVRHRRQLLPVDGDALGRILGLGARRATTSTTGSPTQQARSTAIGYCGADFMPGKQVSVPTHGPVTRLASSAPVMTSATPGWRLASVVSMLHDPGVRMRAAHEGGVQHARQRDVVGVAAAPGHGPRGAGARQGAADVAVGPVEIGCRALSDIWLGMRSALLQACWPASSPTASTMA